MFSYLRDYPLREIWLFQVVVAVILIIAILGVAMFQPGATFWNQIEGAWARVFVTNKISAYVIGASIYFAIYGVILTKWVLKTSEKNDKAKRIDSVHDRISALEVQIKQSRSSGE